MARAMSCLRRVMAIPTCAETLKFCYPRVHLGRIQGSFPRGPAPAPLRFAFASIETPHPVFGHLLPASGEKELESPRPAKRGEGGALRLRSGQAPRRVRGPLTTSPHRVAGAIAC